jgi:hypothetical protein
MAARHALAAIGSPQQAADRKENAEVFPPAGAEPYKRDLKRVEYHLLDTGHFALEEDGHHIAELMRQFMWKHVTTK